MENSSPRDLNRLISELTQGKELTRQLETQIEQSCPPEQYKHLVQNLLSTWDKAIFMARSSSESHGGMGGGSSGAGADSPGSLSGSPRSEGSDRAMKDQESRKMSKKRKALPKWTRRVDMSSPAGQEGALEDGFSWRKYGQKDILGARFPRGYYRCTHRYSQGCPATKLVQRSDDNISVFDVTYRGHHTCVQRANSAPEASTTTAAAAEREQRRRQQQQQQLQFRALHPTHGDATANLSLPGFRTAFTMKTEDLGGSGGPSRPSSPSFSFPSTPVGWASPALDSPFTGSFPPPFISPRAASEPSCFPASPSHVGLLGGEQRAQAPELEFTDVLHGAASAANSGTVDLGFMLDPVESDPNFPFDSGFFS